MPTRYVTCCLLLLLMYESLLVLGSGLGLASPFFFFDGQNEISPVRGFEWEVLKTKRLAKNKYRGFRGQTGGEDKAVN
jgi:hypothetical protein